MKQTRLMSSVVCFLLLGCSGPYLKVKCPPDDRPVLVLKDVDKAYPTYARDYKANLEAVTQALSIRASHVAEVIKLRQDLDQDSGRLADMLKTVVIAMQGDPCNDQLRARLTELLDKINERSVRLSELAQRLRAGDDATHAIYEFRSSYPLVSDSLSSSLKPLVLSVPDNVETVYLFLQKDGPLTSDNCEMLDLVTRDEFITRVEEFRNLARQKLAGVTGRLIVTAQSSEGEWVQEAIKYQGKALKPRPYSCNPKPAGGAEIPLQ